MHLISTVAVLLASDVRVTSSPDVADCAHCREFLVAGTDRFDDGLMLMQPVGHATHGVLPSDPLHPPRDRIQELGYVLVSRYAAYESMELGIKCCDLLWIALGECSRGGGQQLLQREQLI